MPELEHLARANLASKDKARAATAKALLAKLEEVLGSRDHQWYQGRIDPAEQRRREQEREEFQRRYR